MLVACAAMEDTAQQWLSGEECECDEVHEQGNPQGIVYK